MQARESPRMNARLKELLAADTGQTIERMSRDINRDYWMSADEARAYGVVDTIVGVTEARAAADPAEAAVAEAPRAPPQRTGGPGAASSHLFQPPCHSEAVPRADDMQPLKPAFQHGQGAYDLAPVDRRLRSHCSRGDLVRRRISSAHRAPQPPPSAHERDCLRVGRLEGYRTSRRPPVSSGGASLPTAQEGR